MDVKTVLRKNNITLQQFAESLSISRPTLDTYIKLFQSGEPISKSKYNIIFNELFSSELSNEEFSETYTQFVKMIKRDINNGILDLDPEHTDLLNSITNSIGTDLSIQNYNDSVYYFIKIIINNYRRNIVFETLAEYFSLLNGEIDFSDVNEKHKAFYANYFKLFKELQENSDNVLYDELDYENFVERCKKIKDERLREKNQITEIISQRVEDAINELQSTGVSLDELDNKQIIDELIRHLDKQF